MAAPVVPLMVVHSAFQARVVAARLGVDGIPVQLTGSVDGPCPVGTTTLWVLAADEHEARDLLLIDEAEWCLRDAAAAEADPSGDEVGPPRSLDRARRAGVALLLALPCVGVAVTSLAVRLG